MLAAVLSGCGVTPQVPLGAPLAPNEVALRGGWGTSHGRATARVVDENGAVHELVGNGDSAQGVQPLNPSLLVLHMVGARLAVTPRWDAGMYAGWYGAGGGGRYRLTAPESGFGAYLGADAQVGYGKPSALPLPFAGRLLAEFAGRLGDELSLLGDLGVSGGRRLHGVDLTSLLEGTLLDGPPFVPGKVMSVARHELRLEGGVGTAFETQRVVLEMLFMPYVVLAHGSPTRACLGAGFCEPILDYEQSWGFSVLVDLLPRVRAGAVNSRTR